MSWIKKALNNTFRDSGSVLMQLLDGSILEDDAIQLLIKWNDPETCSKIDTLIQDARTNPNGKSILSNIKVQLQCDEFMQHDQNEITQPIDSADSVELTDQRELD